MPIVKYRVNNYKCFKDNVSFDTPKLVNLIIGKNNSGKTSFLNMMEFIYSKDKPIFESLDKIDLDYQLSGDEIRKIGVLENYLPSTSSNYKIASKLAGCMLSGVITNKDFNINIVDGLQRKLEDCYPSDDYDWDDELFMDFLKANYARSEVIKITAERDIHSEPKVGGVSVKENGENFTSVMTNQSHDAKSNRRIVDNIRKRLNEILDGDDNYQSLALLSGSDNKYTISLGEQYSEIPITDMGSGLKTLLLVFYHLEKAKAEHTKPIFMFEELENNLHPEIQRRLFDMLYKYAVENNTTMFITTHSHVAINCLYGQDKAMIYHIKKLGINHSTIQTINTQKDGQVILSDLGIHASDIFQTNGIIWVEGPSDRVYINAWLNVINPDLKENKHYTFLYYGGKNLAHFDLEEENELISILLTNRNSAIVIDSDIKDDKNIRINSTKERIKEEFEHNKMFCWVTEGREIENYISNKILNKKYPDKEFRQIYKYEDFKDYIKDSDSNFDNHKVLFARSLKFEKEEELDVLDLLNKIKNLSEIIKKWND